MERRNGINVSHTTIWDSVNNGTDEMMLQLLVLCALWSLICLACCCQYGLRMAGEELPFYPREKLIEKQKFFQSMSKHTYLKGPFDKITSVAIPVAFAAASCYMIGRGIYNMSHGIGKKE